MFSNLQLDILDTSDNLVGAGPITAIINASVTTQLDAIGSLSVSVPASSARVQEILEPNRQIRLHNTDGVLGQGRIDSIQPSHGTDGKLVYTISARDMLSELADRTTGYNSVYNDKDLKTVIVGDNATTYSLLYGTGWAQGDVEDYGNTTINYDAVSRFSALQTLARQIGRHIRQHAQGERDLDLGLFGDDSGVIVRNIASATSATSSLVLLSSVTLKRVVSDVENRLYPLGQSRFDLRYAPSTCSQIKVVQNQSPDSAGTYSSASVSAGETAISVIDATGFGVDDEIFIGDPDNWTLSHEIAIVSSIATGTTDTINLRTPLKNSYGDLTPVLKTPQFYVEDTSSQSAYGLRESCPQFGWIGPGDKSAGVTIQEKASEVLYNAAMARLSRYSVEYKSYMLGDVINLPLGVRVGDMIHVDYYGTVNAYGGQVIERINDDFYITKITRSWNGDKSVAKLEVSNVDRPTPNNAALVLFNLDTNRWIGMR